MAGRASQVVAEAALQATANGRASQTVVESLDLKSPQGRSSQLVVESIDLKRPTARASQVVAEAILVPGNTAKVTQVVIEVLTHTLETGMPPIFPDGALSRSLGFSVNWVPTFYGQSVQAGSGASIDLALSQYPTHDFELVYDNLHDAPGELELKTLLGFFLRVQGPFGRFLFRNPDDCKVVGQHIGTTDGASHVFGPLVRTYGVGDNSGTEPVGYVDLTADFNLYLNGVLQPKDSYTVLTSNPVAQQIQFVGIPAAGQEIRVDMSYFYYCKFVDNQQTFEKFMHQIWQNQAVNIRSTRAGT